MTAGQLEVITGCMFSGKTEELIRRLDRLQYAPDWKYVLVKPTIDNRYGKTSVATHNGRKLDSFLLAPGKETLDELTEIVGKDRLKEAAVIAFDEGQFFSEKLPELCEELVAMGKRVIVAGLDLDFRAKPFGPMPQLLALADEVTKLKAICVKCGKPATRTQRLVNGKPAPLNDRTILVGGSETYEARCRDCYEPPK